ncbi:MAG: RNA 2',3'-cyclic phosphodiesterase [Actinobacteria bacterium]|nr:RNA 2',3'-cyclic phosphodiesterase [Actinomycetota bacterium]
MPSTLRLFAALIPPAAAVEHLDAFLEPRRDADPDLRWAGPEQWHLTLAFAPDVPEYLLDDVTQRLASAAQRRRLGPLAVAGGGAFPDPDRARVLWAALAHDVPSEQDELTALARGARTAFATAGADVDGQRFRAHLTLARLRRPANVTRWVRVLESYAGPGWTPATVSLVASYLGQGPRRAPRYEIVAACPLGQ